MHVWRGGSTGITHQGDDLACGDVITGFNLQFVIVCVSGLVAITVINFNGAPVSGPFRGRDYDATGDA